MIPHPRRHVGGMRKSDTITKEVATRGQTVVYQEILRIKGVPVRVEIKSDAYKEQSLARIERWDGTQWQHVHHLNDRSTKVGLYVHSDRHDEAHFKADRDKLVQVYTQVTS